MKNKMIKILMIVMFICGFGILVYPIISNFLMNINQTTAIQNYNYTVEDMLEEEKDKIVQEANTYNEKFKSVMIVDPFSSSASEKVDNEYEDILNINGIMGYLEIPKIEVNLPIYHGTSEEVLKKGVGHIETTPIPVGGKGNHSVLSAHRGLPEAKLFTDLDKVIVGDIFTINILNEILYYKVNQIKVVEPTETNDLQAEAGNDYITLITCTPYAINTHRLLVRGERVYDDTYLASINNKVKEDRIEINILVVSAILIFIILIVLFIYIKKKRKVNDE